MAQVDYGDAVYRVRIPPPAVPEIVLRFNHDARILYFDITSPLIIANVSLRLFRNPARNFGSATESVGLQSKWE